MLLLTRWSCNKINPTAPLLSLLYGVSYPFFNLPETRQQRSMADISNGQDLGSENTSALRWQRIKTFFAFMMHSCFCIALKWPLPCQVYWLRFCCRLFCFLHLYMTFSTWKLQMWNLLSCRKSTAGQNSGLTEQDSNSPGWGPCLNWGIQRLLLL